MVEKAVKVDLTSMDPTYVGSEQNILNKELSFRTPFQAIAGALQKMNSLHASASKSKKLQHEIRETPIVKYRPGEYTTGTISSFTKDGSGVFVDVGAKHLGLLEKCDLSFDGKTNAKDIFEAGQEIVVQIKDISDSELHLSWRSVLMTESVEILRKLQRDGTIFDVKVISTNQHGCYGKVEGLRAFLPRSHVLRASKDETLQGKTIPCKLLNMTYDEEEPEKFSMTISNRVAVQEMKKEVVARLRKGALVEGVVSGIKPYGVFVKLKKGPSAIIHMSQISTHKVNIRSLPLKIGDPIKAIVEDVDVGKGRISLSTRSLEMEYERGIMLTHPQRIFDNAEELTRRIAEREKVRTKESEVLAEAFLDQFGDLFAA
jgi:small subunit ribosomal protein S1